MRRVADAQRAAVRNRTDLVAQPLDWPGPDENAPQQHALAAEQAMRLRELMQTLSPQQRAILSLRIVVGLNANDTARALGMSASAVRVAHTRRYGSSAAASPITPADRCSAGGRILRSAAACMGLGQTVSRPRFRHLRSRYPTKAITSVVQPRIRGGAGSTERDASAARGRVMDHVHQNGAFGAWLLVPGPSNGGAARPIGRLGRPLCPIRTARTRVSARTTSTSTRSFRCGETICCWM